MKAAEGRNYEGLAALLSSENLPIKPLLGRELGSEAVRLDLSKENPRLLQTAEHELNAFIAAEIRSAGGMIGVGGYAEDRGWYQRSSAFFDGEEPRTVHLGVDIWVEPGTPIYVPIAGKIHSFANNAAMGDYGPTIILEHEVDGNKFHSLYGHLSLESLVGKREGMELQAGEKLAEVGSSEVNGCWPPHLHLQLIIDLEGKRGDYPGVAAHSKLPFYLSNCPDPNLLLKLEQLQESAAK